MNENGYVIVEGEPLGEGLIFFNGEGVPFMSFPPEVDEEREFDEVFRVRPWVDFPEMVTAENGGRKWSGKVPPVRVYWLTPFVTGNEPLTPDEMDEILEADEPMRRRDEATFDYDD